MIRPRTRWLVPALLVLAATLPAQDAEHRVRGRVLLRYHPTSGAQHRYVEEFEVHMRADTGSPVTLPEQRFRTLTYSLHEVTGPVTGGFAVTTRTDSAFVEAVLPTGETRREELTQLRGTIGGLLYDDRMQLVRAEFVDAQGQTSEVTESLAENARAFGLAAFPQRAVGVGDSWEETIDVPMELPGVNEPLSLAVRLTLRDVRLDGADTTIVVALAFRLPDDPLEVVQGEERFSITFTGRWTGELRYSLTRGTTAALDMGGSIRVDIVSSAATTPPLALRMDQRMSQRLVVPAGP